MNWDDLTAGQKSAAGSAARRLVVFGGAGSGKTTVALWRARYFLDSPASSPWHRVLFLTFSRTAVKEISRRSGRSLLGLRERVEIQTFHSFAHRMITSFGRYAGLGRRVVSLQSKAQERLFGRSEKKLGYEDLIPLALRIIRDPRVKQLLVDRWPLVICDEFQDTDEGQWELLCELASAGSLVLLADLNQMIYDALPGRRGTGPNRVEQAEQLADSVVDLGLPSHRDPSNVIPAMAEAIRLRQFDAPAVRRALELDRLRIRSSVPADLLFERIREEIAVARREGAESIGIFAHGNEPVANLSARLIEANVDHVLIGLPEAHGEALAAMESLCRYGLGLADSADIRAHLATFLTSSVRGDSAPPLARMLLGQLPLPNEMEGRLAAACAALTESAQEGLEELLTTAVQVWPGLRITAGGRAWSQASRTFGATAQQVLRRTRSHRDEFLAELALRVGAQRTDNFLDLDVGADRIVKLMNFHQTKGREADVVILIYSDSDWFGREVEPFPRSSRLLYVSLTRARQRNVVILSPQPHQLVAPFAAVVGAQGTHS